MTTVFQDALKGNDIIISLCYEWNYDVKRYIISYVLLYVSSKDETIGVLPIFLMLCHDKDFKWKSKFLECLNHLYLKT